MYLLVKMADFPMSSFVFQGWKNHASLRPFFSEEHRCVCHFLTAQAGLMEGAEQMKNGDEIAYVGRIKLDADIPWNISPIPAGTF